MLERVWRKGNLLTLLVGMQTYQYYLTHLIIPPSPIHFFLLITRTPTHLAPGLSCHCTFSSPWPLNIGVLSPLTLILFSVWPHFPCQLIHPDACIFSDLLDLTISSWRFPHSRHFQHSNISKTELLCFSCEPLPLSSPALSIAISPFTQAKYLGITDCHFPFSSHF